MAVNMTICRTLLLLGLVIGIDFLTAEPIKSTRDSRIPLTTIEALLEADLDLESDEDFSSVNGVFKEYDASLFCRCWSVVADTISSSLETECKCRGLRITVIPQSLPSDIHRLTMYNCGLKELGSELQNYADTLTDFVIDKAIHLESINEAAFYGLEKLQRIYIRRAPLLTILPDGLFRISLPSLHILLIKQTGLQEFPNLTGLETFNILHTVDLEDNQLENVPTNSVRLRVDDFLLSSNVLRSISGYAFNGSQIATLRFKGNRLLDNIDPEAFMGLTSLRRLDLSQTAVSSLPVRGLTELEILELTETRTLKKIPSVYNYQNLLLTYDTCLMDFPCKTWYPFLSEKSLQEAHLTYPYHCCAFAFPATHDPEEHARHQRFIIEMQNKYCNESSENGTHIHSYGQGYVDFGIDISHQNQFNYHQDDGEDEFFHPTPFQTPSDREILFHAFCGNFTQSRRQVTCTPQPDAFNPCEDILGTNWLRVAAWFVSVAAVVGNLAVVLVLLHASRRPVTVSKFLMVNLASADLCMGLYLILIVGMDFNTMGVYFNYAIDWQNGLGCQVAGFLTVFATELSVFTLVVITSERWYTITYAINLTRRLRLSTTTKIVVLGWIGALIVAALPLAGISSFSTTSICLPLENHNLQDTIYLLLLLVLNGLAFIFICICYGHMYKSISGHSQTLASHSDATVAKKMALLVFTNFACWTPIAFFGLTAVAGYPLISVTNSKILLVFFYPLNACTNPYLYALITKQYRRDLFTVLAKYGFCTERAARYRTTTLSGRCINPIRAGTQFETVLQGGGVPGSPHFVATSHENIEVNRMESFRKPSGEEDLANRGNHRSSIKETSLCLNINPCSTLDDVVQQEMVILTYKEEPVFLAPKRPNLVLETADDQIIDQHSGGKGMHNNRVPAGCSTIDSPHPMKHRQIR